MQCLFGSFNSCFMQALFLSDFSFNYKILEFDPLISSSNYHFAEAARIVVRQALS